MSRLVLRSSKSRSIPSSNLNKRCTPAQPKISALARTFMAKPRGFHSSLALRSDMFCFQCEQTRDQSGCKTVGVCGKTATTATLQDLLIHCVKGVSIYAAKALEFGPQYRDIDVDRFVLEGLFATMTNVNFDDSRMIQYIKTSKTMRDRAKELYHRACKENKATAKSLGEIADFDFPVSLDLIDDLQARGKAVGIEERKEKFGDDFVGLQELCMYGLKGTAAYAEHAVQLAKEDSNVYARMHQALYKLTDDNATVDELLGLAMEVGNINLRVMELLDNGHVDKFGHPSPHEVTCTPKPGKSILVSGHDLVDLEALLKQTEGTGVNVYTHGEMLPAHGYPELRKYKHLAGHYGGPWQLQKWEFSAFPGPIIMTTNCIIEPLRSYKKRIFTRSVTGFPGVTHITDRNFKEVIDCALSEEGFDSDSIETTTKRSVTVGFARNAVLGVADKVIEAVKTGDIKRFFVIGGCDGSEGERNYFTDLAKATPKDTIILTLGCGKYKFNRLELGTLGGLPRVLDMGQCNDAYSGIQIAVALAAAFKTDVNSLPITFAVSWLEQKAVAVLLTLLSLNIQNIHLGPHLPAFCTPNMAAILTEKFKLQQIDYKNVKGDLAKMMAGH